MPVTPNAQPSPKSAFRTAVRERAFSAALERVGRDGWNHLRISQLAKDIGVSRPTIYTEFGTKEEFGQALLEHETQRVLTGFSETLSNSKARPARTLELAYSQAIDLGQSSPLVAAVLSPSATTEAGTSDAYQFITEGLVPLIAASSYVLAQWVKQNWPEISDARIQSCTDAMARLTLSHIMTPSSTPTKTPKHLAQITLALLPELSQ